MARPILLSNGTLHVGINLYGMVHDLYYPYVGLENHATAKRMRWRIGVWTEGSFSWLDDGMWQFTYNYEPHALISHTRANNENLGVALEFTDCVDSDVNVFLRSVHVINAQNSPRQIRLFMCQMMLISNSLNSDTGQYIPGSQAILHYKGDRAFVVGAKNQQGKSFDQFSVGLFGLEEHEGVYRDAEDGVLSSNVVEFGQVDSAIGFNLQLDSYSSTRVHYWFTAAKSQAQALALHAAMQKADVGKRFIATAAFWQRWLRPAEKHVVHMPKALQVPMRKNLLVVKSQIDRRGAVIASTDSTMLNYWRDAYAYCWPRDAAYALWPLLRLGYKTELKNFFAFCRDALQPGGYLMHKYRPDGAVGTSWHPYLIDGRVIPPIQEDETAIVIFLLGEYVKSTKDKKTLQAFYKDLVVPAATFMVGHINPKTKLPHASYDLWEEKFLTTTYTTAVVYAALCAAADMAKRLHHHTDVVRWQSAADDIRTAANALLFNQQRHYFYKGFLNKNTGEVYRDETIDVSSFYGAFMFGLFDIDSPKLQAAHQTLRQLYSLEGDNPTIIGRYEYDKYNTIDKAGLGNPWFVTSLWLAQYDIRTNHHRRAQATVEWAANCMLTTGVLPEQINPFNQKFVSVAPLTWSQAEFLNTVIDISRRKESLS